MYDSKASHGELGADFFPEGSQRVYVNSYRSHPTIWVLTISTGVAREDA